MAFSIYIVLFVYLGLLFTATVMSAAETSVLLLTPGRVYRLAEAERKGAVPLSELSDRRHRLRAASALCAALAHGGAALTGWLWGLELESEALSGVLALVLVVVTYSITQSLPRTFAVTNPERVALSSAAIALVSTHALYPFAAFGGGVWKWAIALTGAERPFSPWAVTPELRSANDAAGDAEREVAEEALLEAVSDFAEKVVREVMVPRTDMTAIEDTASVADAIAMIAETGVSRIPLYHETIDDVRGVLYAKDLLTASCAGKDANLQELAREPYFIPETKPVEELLRDLRSRTHIAIVADEYGGTSGLVTLEDLLEEIVGDISDEYDVEEPLLTDLGDGCYRVDARLPVDDLNELFGMDLDTDADSVGGLFTEVAGHIPEQGESVEFEGVRLTVTQLEGTRILALNVEPATSGGNGVEGA